MWAPMTGPTATNTPASTAPESMTPPASVTPTKMTMLIEELELLGARRAAEAAVERAGQPGQPGGEGEHEELGEVRLSTRRCCTPPASRSWRPGADRTGPGAGRTTPIAASAKTTPSEEHVEGPVGGEAEAEDVGPSDGRRCPRRP